MKNILLKKRLLKGMIPLLCLLLFPTFVFAQKLTVSGQVKDALGEPVIGANVVVKGTTNGAMTDLDGMFTINEVEKGSTIVVSFIGYLPQSMRHYPLRWRKTTRHWMKWSLSVTVCRKRVW